MPARPLALIAGRIHEHPDSGSYPLIRLVGGRLWAGGTGNNVYLLDGRLAEVKDEGPYVAPGYWVDGYADAYVNEGYVAAGYVGAPTEQPEPTGSYVADGYVTEGYVEV